jgi:hypothetical protein
MTQAERPAGRRASLEAWLDAQGSELPLRLTLLTLLLVPVGQWEVRSLLLLVAAAGLLHEGALRAWWIWLLLAALTGWRVIDDWPLSDNHAYLLSYWCLAIGLALLTRDAGQSLARSARLLVTLAMAFAVLWKGVVSPDYVDNRFFRLLFLTDDRFEALALNLGGMTEATLDQARLLVEENRHEPAGTAPASLETPALRQIAWLSTWWTLAIELLVAVLFILPKRLGVGRLRDAALLVFCATTYALAPVCGFGWLLLTMGVAQCPLDARTTRWLYLGCFALMVLHQQVPWLELVPRRT